MLKTKLDIDDVKEIEFSWIDNGFDKYHFFRKHLSSYFKHNKLDNAVMEHLYGVLLIRPSGFPSVNNDCSIKTYMTEMESLEYLLSGDPINRVAFIFKNVDKRLQLPLLLIRGVLSTSSSSAEMDLDLGDAMGNATSVAFHDDDVVKANPKNLMRYCGFPERDAKALFNNLKMIDGQIFLPKTNSPSKDVNRLAIYMLDNPPSHSWYVDSLISGESIELTQGRASLVQIEKLMAAHPLPISDLRIWREITKRWYERNKPQPWAKLSLQAQKRHMVNMIRHNSIGYTQAYSNVEPELADILHDLAFDAIMRKIANTFPFLRIECQRQWEYREQHEEQWNNLTY